MSQLRSNFFSRLLAKISTKLKFSAGLIYFDFGTLSDLTYYDNKFGHESGKKAEKGCLPPILQHTKNK